MAFKPIRKFVMPEVQYGPDSRCLAGPRLLSMGLKRVLLVTDEGVRHQPWMQMVLDGLNASEIEVVWFADVSPNPRDHEVRKGVCLYLSTGCQGILAVGGGSPMDCAKGIGIMVSNQRDILEFRGVDLVEKALPPTVFIPTTAGSASEVSRFAIILNTEEQVKIAIVSDELVPKLALCDARTTETVDKNLVAATGMDVLVHAVEAYVSTGHSDLTDLHAREAVHLVKRHLPQLMRNLDDEEARNGMMLGSMLAGLAFSNAILGAVHALAHALGGLLDLPHGECNAILLPHVVAFNYDVESERYDQLGIWLGVSPETLVSQKKDALLAAIHEMQQLAGMDHGLASVGVREEDLRSLAAKAREDPCLLTNPKACSHLDLEAILRMALPG